MSKRTDAPSAAVRIRVMKRDRFRCTYCGTPGTDVELEVDHVVPVANGGSHHISNLTTACRRCNQLKGVRRMKPNAHATPPSGLIGLFLHTYKDGRIQYQAQIIGVDGDKILAQMFSWIMGEPTDVRAFDRDFIYSDECRLYADEEVWRSKAEEGELREQAAQRDKLRIVR